MESMLQTLLDASSFILAWYNLPFSLMIALCLALAALQLTGMSGEQEHDADADADVHVDVHVDADIHMDADIHADVDTDADLDGDLDHDVDHNVDQDAEGEGEHEAAHEGSFSVLAFIGAGKAPLMVVLLILFGSIGLLGWLLNGLVSGLFGFFPAVGLLVTLPAALVGGAAVSARLSRWIGQVLPPFSTTAVSEQSLVGRQATVVSPWVDHRSGQVRLRDHAGTLIRVSAVTGDSAVIRRGEEVLLTEWDKEKRVYIIQVPQPTLQRV